MDRNSGTIERFFRYADYAFNLMKRVYPYNETFYDRDELVNVCWLTGHWLRYLDRSDYWISTVMKFDMMQYMNAGRFGREHKKKHFQLTPIDGNFDIAIEYPDIEETIDDCLDIFARIENPGIRVMAILNILAGLTTVEIAERFGCTQQNVSYHLNRIGVI